MICSTAFEKINTAPHFPRINFQKYYLVGKPSFMIQGFFHYVKC